MYGPPAPAQKKHTEESSRPASTAGADAMKAVQQHLQNAFQPAPQAAPPSSTKKKKHTEASFQPAPQPAQSQKKKKKHTEESSRPASAAGADMRKAVQQLLQNAFQPAPQTKHKALQYRPAFASFASNLKDASKLARAAFQAAPAPSSGGWNTVSINPNGTFTLPLIGTYPLPPPGQMKKIDLQDGKFYKIRQRADGAYEGKFGPDSLPAPQQPKAPKHKSTFASFASNLKYASKLARAAFQAAPAPSSGGWSPVSINRNGTFTMPSIGT
ncbi:MAG TPA: hypothetical protein VE057_22315, partial [Archangium sp.]|nr:hypothetical protein [Archangium sp.]